ncbi:hypothetical protein [Kitasatospora aureofaciens]|uniref:hypothetical protein n=1 Tax=Kitasatospora aureofaciens TaxID=1894 RepID=UPI001C46BBDF|nr:hypothetical protein [Kitasatospora aureofaciens]MBV6697008.1 hypothetical protein [Kitasatospora aureofaciens]
MTNDRPAGVPVLVLSHHAESKLALTTDLAAELLAEGTGPLAEGAGLGLERHWLHGPHIRIWGAGDRLDAVAARARAVLDRHRSPQPLDEAGYLARSEALGRAELVPGPYGPLRPDNTVAAEELPAEQITGLIGTAGFRLKQQVMAEFLPALAVSRGLGDLPGGIRAIAPMVALAATWPVGGVRSGHLTYRSHLEEYLHLHDPDGLLRARFAEQHARVAEPVDRIVAAVLDGIDDDHPDGARRGPYTGADPVTAAWSAAFGRALGHATAAAERGELGEDLGPGYAARAARHWPAEQARWEFGDDRGYSEFHRSLRRLDHLPERVHVTEFAAYRFVVNQFLRTVPLLDVSPVERYFAAFALCDSVERLLGVDWRELLATGAEARS